MKMIQNDPVHNLIEFMRCLDFHVDVIRYDPISKLELIGKKCKDPDRIEWFTVEQEGSGFTKMFKGSIKSAFECQQSLANRIKSAKEEG